MGIIFSSPDSQNASLASSTERSIALQNDSAVFSNPSLSAHISNMRHLRIPAL